MKSLKSSTLLLVLYEIFNKVLCEDQLYNTLHGTIGEGNYTYYKLVHMGYIRLLLDSSYGDADIYISSSTTTPTYEDYDECVTTCGQDVVDIPPQVERPVTIGVYGHPSYEKSVYSLHVMVLTDYEKGYPEETYFDEEMPSSSQSKSGGKHHKKNFSSTPKDEEESILWTILVGILKILFDILM